jgi:hypothetical protein
METFFSDYGFTLINNQNDTATHWYESKTLCQGKTFEFVLPFIAAIEVWGFKGHFHLVATKLKNFIESNYELVSLHIFHLSNDFHGFEIENISSFANGVDDAESRRVVEHQLSVDV